MQQYLDQLNYWEDQRKRIIYRLSGKELTRTLDEMIAGEEPTSLRDVDRAIADIMTYVQDKVPDRVVQWDPEAREIVAITRGGGRVTVGGGSSSSSSGSGSSGSMGSGGPGVFNTSSRGRIP